jgi:hypothetical protein
MWYIYTTEYFSAIKHNEIARHWWITSVILATQEADSKRITVRSQPRQIFPKTLPRKYPTHKKKGWSSGSIGRRLA